MLELEGSTKTAKIETFGSRDLSGNPICAPSQQDDLGQITHPAKPQYVRITWIC